MIDDTDTERYGRRPHWHQRLHRPWYRRQKVWNTVLAAFILGFTWVCYIWMAVLVGDFLMQLAHFIGYVPWWRR